MRSIHSIIFAIVFSVTANSFAFASVQTSPELQHLVTQLHDATLSDEGSFQLKALAGNNADARRQLTRNCRSSSRRPRKIRRNIRSGSIVAAKIYQRTT
jgi:hypothetical protein